MKSEDPIKRKDYSFLETFGSIDEEKDWQKLRTQMKAKRTIRLSPLWKVAAVALVLLSVGFLALQRLNPGAELHRVQAESGIRELTLPDGSLAILKQGSTLSWREKFGGKQREVHLQGEAWFEVVKNPQRSFRVEVDHRALVEVLGTRFNVRSEAPGATVSVQVEEGRVAFSAKGRADEGLELNAGQGAAMDAGGALRSIPADPNDLSWRTGILVFDQHPLAQVLSILQEYYDTPMELDSSVDRGLEFTSVIRNQELDLVLEEMCLVLGLSYQEEEGSIYIRPAP